jgi:hypothetical protein
VITATQLFAHALGDYVLQSDWQALEKTKRHFPALVHAVVYACPFVLFFWPSLLALLVIVGTHFLIDRYRLARYVVWAKNFLAPRSYWRSWAECQKTGYPADRPDWLTVWLLIIADNTLHVGLNGLALTYL